MNHLEIETEMTEKETSEYVDWQKFEGAKPYIKIIMDTSLTKEGAIIIWKTWKEMTIWNPRAVLEAWEEIREKVSAAVMMTAEDAEPIKDGYDLELERAERIRKENS